jgi:archaeal flagellar protein FlaI
LKKRLLDFVDDRGKVSLSLAAQELEADNASVASFGEELSREGKLNLIAHYLTEPELESVEASKRVAEAVEKPSESIHTEAPEVKPDRKSAGDKEVEKRVLDEYVLESDDVHFKVRIVDEGDYVPYYTISVPKIDFVTRALLDETKKALINEISLTSKDVFDSDKFQKMKSRFVSRAKNKLRNVLKKSSEEYVATLSRLLVNEMIGLGDVEYLLLDNMIEEVVVNNSRHPIWVYHKDRGWLKTNIVLPTEDLISNYSARIAREVGREINHMHPLLDAHLSSGDRVNATLSPISTAGNTITIRRFSRVPWSPTRFMAPDVKTYPVEVAAFLWLAVEYELSILVAGGTASGKTSTLNSLMPFMPANQRIVSIEDTRELNLPSYLHWVPMTTRPSNPEGEGGITMLELLQNSLRMRPDRIIVGEVRAKREAEVLFESMHTGHSVYSTFHAERAQEVVDRITTPPMSIPPTVMKSLHLIMVQYRNRRTGARRMFELCELLKDDTDMPTLNTLYKWDPKTDSISKMYPSIRVREELGMFTAMGENEIEDNLSGKKTVLEAMIEEEILDVNDVGRVVTEYYLNDEKVLDMIRSGKPLKGLIERD